MNVITIASLSGGQGKSTTCFFLGKLLAQQGKKVLIVDADPQSNLTLFLGHRVENEQPTLLELIKKTVAPEDAVYALETANLFLVPADDGLSSVQEYLATSGMGAIVLRHRLSSLSKLFDFCIIDSPPARSQISSTAIGAGDFVVIPAEASTKGVNSLARTLELIENLAGLGAFGGKILGILPFRDRWFGRSRSKDSTSAIDAMVQIAPQVTLFPSIVESERYKHSLNQGVLLHELGFPELQHPFEQIASILTQEPLTPAAYS